MKCRACKCVWYCDKDCQNKHWKEHKKECKPIKKVLDKRGGKLDLGTEKDLGPLPDVPPREECPICMRALPLVEGQHSYETCCGKKICSGCDFQHQRKSGERPTCAFCREPIPDSDEEILARTRKRIELKDPHAMRNMASYHGYGWRGLPKDRAKCIDLLRQCDELGCPVAQFQLAQFYHNGTMGLEQNEEEALKYWKKAAEGGHVQARNNLACTEERRGDDVAAMRHWRLSAAGGGKLSMENLIICFEIGLLHHADLTETLQAFYRSRSELKSEDRDQYIKYLKEIGKYKDEYEW